MDLKQQIDQLDEVIIKAEADMASLKITLKAAKIKRNSFAKLLLAAEALEEQKPETKK